MQELGRITFKVKLGGALDLLCLAGAGAIVVHSLVEIVDCGRRLSLDERNEKFDQMLEESIARLRECSENLKNTEVKEEEEL